MRVGLCLVAAIASLSMLAADRVSLRVQTSKRFARVTVYVQPRPEHRALIVSGTVVDDEGEHTWERVSGFQLDGENSRRQHLIEWHPNPGILHVRADAIGMCGSAQGVGLVGW